MGKERLSQRAAEWELADVIMDAKLRDEDTIRRLVRCRSRRTEGGICEVLEI